MTEETLSCMGIKLQDCEVGDGVVEMSGGGYRRRYERGERRRNGKANL
jgi:hypothetical protein